MQFYSYTSDTERDDVSWLYALDTAKFRVNLARSAAFAASHTDECERTRTNEELTAAIDALMAML